MFWLPSQWQKQELEVSEKIYGSHKKSGRWWKSQVLQRIHCLASGYVFSLGLGTLFLQRLFKTDLNSAVFPFLESVSTCNPWFFASVHYPFTAISIIALWCPTNKDTQIQENQNYTLNRTFPFFSFIILLIFYNVYYVLPYSYNVAHFNCNSS